MKSLLGIGECMIELSSVKKNLWQQSFAGDVFNTLWYAKAFANEEEISINFFTAVGDDDSSKEMIKFITESGVSCNNIPTIPKGVPGLYKIHLNEAERTFSYWRDTSAAKQMMQKPELLWSQVANADIVYLSGITMAILPPKDAEMLIQDLRQAMKPSAIIAFDPNIRPRLWESQERMKDIITKTGAISDLVMPSFEDEQITFGDSSPLETSKRYQSLGATQIIVKNSDDDTLLVDGDIIEHFPVKQVKNVVDTTAAGDSFNGAYLTEFLKTGDKAKSIQAAHHCSSTVIQNKGALVSFETIQANV